MGKKIKGMSMEDIVKETAELLTDVPEDMREAMVYGALQTIYNE